MCYCWSDGKRAVLYFIFLGGSGRLFQQFQYVVPTIGCPMVLPVAVWYFACLWSLRSLNCLTILEVLINPPPIQHISLQAQHFLGWQPLCLAHHDTALFLAPDSHHLPLCRIWFSWTGVQVWMLPQPIHTGNGFSLGSFNQQHGSTAGALTPAVLLR